tara:strand:- start:1497 stop:2018 length:522 start_codon:yes stop_codon:yes gene_type:complete
MKEEPLWLLLFFVALFSEDSLSLAYLILGPAHSIRVTSPPCRNHANIRRLIMPKVSITDDKGLVQSAGSGLEVKGAHYSGAGTTTAAATGSFPLLPAGIVNTVDSGNNAHGVRLPNAAGPGQLMIVRNVDAGQDVVIRNEAETGAILVTLGEGKTALFVSTDSGNNWVFTAVN